MKGDRGILVGRCWCLFCSDGAHVGPVEVAPDVGGGSRATTSAMELYSAVSRSDYGTVDASFHNEAGQSSSLFFAQGIFEIR